MFDRVFMGSDARESGPVTKSSFFFVNAKLLVPQGKIPAVGNAIGVGLESMDDKWAAPAILTESSDSR